jgi:hypothetical protein
MILKEVKLKLFEGMESKFSQMGFSFYKSESWYERNLEGNIQMIYFIFHKQSDGIYVEPRWAIKIKSILDIYHLISTKDKKHFKYTPVLENSLGELIEYADNGNETGSGKSMKYLIETDKDVEVLIKVIPKRIEEYGLPFFNQNTSVEKIDQLLNTKPRQLSILNWLYPQKACMGLIAAKLINNLKYKELVCIYDEETRNANPTSRQEFLALVKLLEDVKPLT